MLIRNNNTQINHIQKFATIINNHQHYQIMHLVLTTKCKLPKRDNRGHLKYIILIIIHSEYRNQGTEVEPFLSLNNPFNVRNFKNLFGMCKVDIIVHPPVKVWIMISTQRVNMSTSEYLFLGLGQKLVHFVHFVLGLHIFYRLFWVMG